MTILEILPLVVVMISGPQIVSAVFLATSERWRANSIAFVAGAAVSVPLVVSAAYALDVGVVGRGSPSTARIAIVLAALVLAMVHTYRTRDRAEPPRWMGALQSSSPGFSFRLGFLLIGFFPTDLLTSLAVGSYLSGRDAPLWHAAPFVIATLAVLSIPVLTLLAGGDRAERALPSVRDRLVANGWLVSEVVLGFFVIMTLSNLHG
ncbi:GAP family protein [Halovivax cerinus]|uniref:GAP family protein n=1 Tax=Halovivax cerinus TaxID=1487865 RepID=A0ABD5NP40_9EURY|nr:GAP family protein [Halovivax cerinus]